MMSQLVMTDLTRGETLAFLAALFLAGDLSSNEYLCQVRSVHNGPDPKGLLLEQVIERETDWDFLNRMLAGADGMPTHRH